MPIQHSALIPESPTLSANTRIRSLNLPRKLWRRASAAQEACCVVCVVLFWAGLGWYRCALCCFGPVSAGLAALCLDSSVLWCCFVLFADLWPFRCAVSLQLIILRWSLLVSLRFVWFHLWFRAGLLVASVRFAWFLKFWNGPCWFRCVLYGFVCGLGLVSWWSRFVLHGSVNNWTGLCWFRYVVHRFSSPHFFGLM